ncbi:serine protease HtrA [Thermotalea metallivorans]|uniref:Putative serine protease HtrA n=1 Tax=Thermotalea metallivorans TaxID=520762 RepID=A0A140LAA2_9FIRM|nr:trypsin-like peptidase domain-containing protein [Thermotalea metallivorans]KXG77477.1 putative serine protease HtrA [Thermotalea metallivorans]
MIEGRDQGISWYNKDEENLAFVPGLMGRIKNFKNNPQKEGRSMDRCKHHENRDEAQKRRVGELEKIAEDQAICQSGSPNFMAEPKTAYYMMKKTVLFIILLAIPAAAMIGGWIGAYMASKDDGIGAVRYLQGADTDLQSQIVMIAKEEHLDGIPAVVKKAMPSVVGVTTVTVEEDRFFGLRKGRSVGTGVIVDSRGYILTNSHVVNDGRTHEVTILLHDGKDMKAEVLWCDPTLDLAVLKVDGQNLPVATLGNSDRIVVGETAIAIGNPLGLAFERTVTAGIISGLERSIPVSDFHSIEGLIQTDASINPGNSGGPLLNGKGEVIGINTAKIRSGEGLGFAIPINIAKPIVDEFIAKGEFTKVYLGMKGVNAQQYARNYGSILGAKEGVLVYQVVPNGPASKAGMQAGDVITAINGEKVPSMTRLARILYKYRPGDKIKIEVVRNGQLVTLETTLIAETRR